MTTATTHAPSYETKNRQAQPSAPERGGTPAVGVVARLAGAAQGHAPRAGAAARVDGEVGGNAGVLSQLDAALGTGGGVGVLPSGGRVLTRRARHVNEQAHARKEEGRVRLIIIPFGFRGTARELESLAQAYRRTAGGRASECRSTVAPPTFFFGMQKEYR